MEEKIKNIPRWVKYILLLLRSSICAKLKSDKRNISTVVLYSPNIMVKWLVIVLSTVTSILSQNCTLVDINTGKCKGMGFKSLFKLACSADCTYYPRSLGLFISEPFSSPWGEYSLATQWHTELIIVTKASTAFTAPFFTSLVGRNMKANFCFYNWEADIRWWYMNCWPLCCCIAQALTTLLLELTKPTTHYYHLLKPNIQILS